MAQVELREKKSCWEVLSKDILSHYAPSSSALLQTIQTYRTKAQRDQIEKERRQNDLLASASRGPTGKDLDAPEVKGSKS
jgi:hypothetical protein